MKIRIKLQPWATTASVLILTTALIAGCGGTKTDTATTEAPKTESPKAEAPKPTESPKAATPKIEQATTGSTFTNEKTLASTTTEQKEGNFAEVKISKLTAYPHPGGLFTIEIPEAWTKKDTSKPDEVIVSWTDPAGNSLIIVDIFEVEATPSKEELGGKLKEFIAGLFGQQPKFAVSDPTPQPDGTMRVEWSYEVTVEAQSGVLLGNSFIEQKGNKVAVLSAAIPKAQFDSLKDSMNKIIASRKIDPAVKIAK